MTSTPRLLLVGGGHATIEVIRRLPARRSYQVVLVDPAEHATYSGLVPAVLARRQALAAATIDLAALCRRHAVDRRQTLVVGLDLEQRRAHLQDGAPLGFTVCALDTGGVAPAAIPGAGAHAVGVKPVSALVRAWDEAEAAAQAHPLDVVILGGGAAGVELALAARVVGATTPRGGRVALVAPAVLPGLAHAAARRATRLLAERGAMLVAGRAARVERGEVILADGDRIPARLIVDATGAAAPAWPARSGLAVDALGFVAVDHHLRSRSHPFVLAAGDIASHPGPDRAARSGVNAVRAGPVLAANLEALMDGRPPPRRFRPRVRGVVILASTEDDAVLAWGPVGWRGRGPAWLKRWLDRRFVARYR